MSAAALREGVLALATGAGAAAAGTYFASRAVWQAAQTHGSSIDSFIDQLRDIHGVQRLPPPQVHTPPLASHTNRSVPQLPTPRAPPVVAQPPPIASPFEAQLKLDLAAAWNVKVKALYDFLRPWVS